MLDGTRKFSLVDESNKEMKRTLTTVYDALKEKGYNPINQIVGYLLSEDPTYITNHNNARSLICCCAAVFKVASFSLVASMASFSIFCFWTTSSVLEGSSFRSLLTSFSPDCVPLIDLFTLSSALESFVVSPPISTVMPWILDAICVTTSSQA